MEVKYKLFKKEIFEIPVISDEFSKDFIKDLKVEIKITQSDVKNKTFRDFLGVIPDSVIDALKNTKVYISKRTSYVEIEPSYDMQFIYPEMDAECRRVMSDLFFSPLDLQWKKDLKLKCYPSKTIILSANGLYPRFVGSTLGGNANGFLTGVIEFRVTNK